MKTLNLLALSLIMITSISAFAVITVNITNNTSSSVTFELIAEGHYREDPKLSETISVAPGTSTVSNLEEEKYTILLAKVSSPNETADSIRLLSGLTNVNVTFTGEAPNVSVRLSS